MELATIQDLARLVMQGALHTLRFASDGRTAVVKYYVGGKSASESDRMLVEKRITPTPGPDGIDRYNVKFLEFANAS